MKRFMDEKHLTTAGDSMSHHYAIKLHRLKKDHLQTNGNGPVS